MSDESLGTQVVGRRSVLKAAGLTTLALATLRSTPARGQQPVAGGVIPMAAYADVETWDPHKGTSVAALSASSPLYNQLVEFDPADPTKIVGDLAERWEVSNDGTTYTFKLHDALWTNGRPVTSADVVFSLDRIKQIGKPRASAWLVYVRGWEATGPQTVRIDLKAPAPAFLAFFAIEYVKILPKEVVGAGVDIEKPENIVGSGPFRFAKWTKGDSYEVSRNPNYFRKGRPYLDGIKHYVIRDRGTLLAAYRAERVLMQNSAYSGLSAQDLLAAREDLRDKCTVHVLPVASSNVGIFLNVKRQHLDDPRVRKAMHLATDRQAFVKLFSHASASSPGAPLPPDTWYGRPSAEVELLPGYRQPKDNDIADARKLLAEAGLSSGFKTSVLVRRVATFADMAAVWKQQMARIGIDVEIRAVESSAGLAAYGQANFDAGMVSSGILLDEPEAAIADAFRVGAVRNYPGWENADVERLVQQQRTELNQSARKRILRTLEDELLSWRNNYWIGLYWEKDQWIVHNKVRGFIPPRTGYAGLKYEHLWLAQ